MSAVVEIIAQAGPVVELTGADGEIVEFAASAPPAQVEFQSVGTQGIPGSEINIFALPYAP